MRLGRRDATDEAKTVLTLALVSGVGPFVVLSLRPIFTLPDIVPLRAWEWALLVGVTPLLSAMALALFIRSPGARARPEGRAGAVVAAATFLLGVAALVILVVRGPA